MSSGLVNTMHGAARWIDPITQVNPSTDLGWDLLKPKKVAGPPAPPNVNDALNNAQQQTDALRARRGVLSNIFAGAQNGGGGSPAVGKTQLGS